MKAARWKRERHIRFLELSRRVWTEIQRAHRTHFFGGNLRKVITTRKDGKMTLDIPDAGNYTLYIQQSY